MEAVLALRLLFRKNTYIYICCTYFILPSGILLNPHFLSSSSLGGQGRLLLPSIPRGPEGERKRKEKHSTANKHKISKAALRRKFINSPWEGYLLPRRNYEG